MVFGTCKIVKCRSITGLGYHPQIHMKTGIKHNGGPGLALRNHLFDIFIGHKALHYFCAVLAGHKDIQIPHRFLSASEASSDCDLFNAFCLFQIFNEGIGPFFRLHQFDALPPVFFPFEGFQNILLCLFAKTFKGFNFSAFGRGFQLIQAPSMFSSRFRTRTRFGPKPSNFINSCNWGGVSS